MRTFVFVAGMVASAGTAMGQFSASGLVVLDPSAPGALSMVGNSDITIPARAVYVNSSSNTAVSTTGNALLDAPNLYVVGHASFGGHSRCTGHVTENAVGYSDPLVATAFPSAQGMSDHAALTIRSGTVTIQPGYYSHGISITGNATVTFAPGVFLIGGTGLRVTAGSITGNGVSFVMLAGSLSIAGSSSLTLTPPTSGPMAGVVIGQPRTNTTGMSLAGGSEVNISGAIYAPGATLSLVGNSLINGGSKMGDVVVANRVSLAGTGAIRIGNPLAPPLELPSLPLFD